MRPWRFLLLLLCCCQIIVEQVSSVDNTFRVTNGPNTKLRKGDTMVSILLLENPRDDSKTLVFVRRDNRQNLRLKVLSKRSTHNIIYSDSFNLSSAMKRKMLLKKNRSSRNQTVQRNCTTTSSASLSKACDDRKINLKQHKKNMNYEISRFLMLKHKRWVEANIFNGTHPRKRFLREHRNGSQTDRHFNKLILRRKATWRVQMNIGDKTHACKKLLLRQKSMQRRHSQQILSQPSCMTVSTQPPIPSNLTISTAKCRKVLLKSNKDRHDTIRSTKLLLRQRRGQHGYQTAVRQKLLLIAKKKAHQSQKSARKLKLHALSRSNRGKIEPPTSAYTSSSTTSKDGSTASDNRSGSISAIIFAAAAILLGTLLHPLFRTPTLAVHDESIQAILSYSRDSEQKKKQVGDPSNVTASPFRQEDDGMAALSAAQREHDRYAIDEEPQLWHSPFRNTVSFGQVCTPAPAQRVPPNTKASTASRMVTRAMSATMAASTHEDGLNLAIKLF